MKGKPSQEFEGGANENRLHWGNPLRTAFTGVP